MNRLGRISFGGPYALAWPTLALYIGPLITFNFVFDREQIQQAPLGLVGYTVCVGVAGLIPLVLARYTLLPVKPRPSRPFLTIFIWVVSATARALMIVAWSSSSISFSSISARILGAVIGTALLLSVSELVVTLFQNWRKQSRNLATEIAGLKTHVEVLEQVAEQDRAEVLAHAKTVIETEMRTVASRVTESRAQSKLSQEIQIFAEEIVRPLSHRIAEFPLRTFEISSLPTKNFWAQISQMVSATCLILPGWSVAILATMTVVARMVAQDNRLPLLEIIPALIATWTVWFVILKLGQRIRTRLVFSYIIALSAGAIAGYIGAGVERLFTLTTPVFHFWIFFFGVWTISAVIATLSAAGRLAQSHLEEQTRLSHSLLELQQRTRQEIWLNRKRLAAGLHGPVQASLQVSLMKLNFSEPKDRPSIDEISRALEDAVRQLDDPPKTTVDDIYRTFADLKTIWMHQCTLCLTIEPDTAELLADDPTSCETLTELLTEAVLNAMKHGESRNIDCHIREEDKRIVLVVRNDGEPLPKSRKPGFGSRAFTELCQEWNLENSSGITQLTATLGNSPKSFS